MKSPLAVELLIEILNTDIGPDGLKSAVWALRQTTGHWAGLCKMAGVVAGE